MRGNLFSNAPMSRPTNDTTLRAIVKTKLARRHAGAEDAFVVEELPVSRGDARVDLAIINGRIEGIELKSSLDTLDRLPRQASVYSQAMDRMTLVAAPSHIAEGVRMVPDWWSVFEAEAGLRGGVRLRRVRQGRLNPSPSARGYLGLLERDELVSLLSAHGLDRGWRSAPWNDLADRVEGSLPVAAVAEGVRRMLKIRILIEARISGTAFGNSAAGGGLNSGTLPTLTGGTPDGSGAD
jgi:hypothetical protein